MRLLVTGGSGFLGGYVLAAAALVALGLQSSFSDLHEGKPC
jgi:uncharacterized protein YbjT (DUF2867 family)